MNKTIIVKETVNSFPLLTVLGFIFIILKLTGHITWSWLWVTCPFWGLFALLFGLFAVFFVGIAIVFIISVIFLLFMEICKTFTGRY